MNVYSKFVETGPLDKMCKGQKFAEELCCCIGVLRTAYVAILHIDNGTITAQSRWVTGTADSPAREATTIRNVCKLSSEMLISGAGTNGYVITSPYADVNKQDLIAGAAINGTVVIVGNVAAEHAKLLALLTLYHLEIGELELDHTGVECANRRILETIRDSLTVPPRKRGLTLDQSNEFCTRGHPYTRYVVSSKIPGERKRYWHLKLSYPDQFLLWLSNHMRVEICNELLTDTKNVGPRKFVWVRNSMDGSVIGVSARKI